jgi:hypothetical protein
MSDVTELVARLRNPIRIKTDYGLELDRREATDHIEQLEALLRVMPGYGLSAYDKGRWEKARNALLGITDSATHREDGSHG